MKLELDDLVEPLSEGLREAIKDVVKDGTEEELIDFTLDVAARTIAIAQLPHGPEKEALMSEHRGAIMAIAERHRINLARSANDQINKAIDVGLAILGRVVDAAI